MGDGSLAEVFEELKELRRRGGKQDVEMHSKLTDVLDALGDTLLATDELPDLKQSGSLVRTLEIKTLADRVFGDEEKAGAWLRRPSPALSGQRPVDLLRDELGTAVVREMLERIDQGIFA